MLGLNNPVWPTTEYNIATLRQHIVNVFKY